MAEWNAEQYNQHSGLQAAMADEQLRRVSFTGSERVLDVGCGDGKITTTIASRVPRGRVTGVDPSLDMITFANRRHDRTAHPNLSFAVADARHLPYSAEFDRVVSFNALHWVPEQTKALRSIRAALVDHGTAMLRFVPQGPRTSLEDVIEQTRRLSPWKDHFHDFQKPYIHLSPDDYQTLATQTDFRVLSLNREDRAWDFRTREAFVAFARATFVAWTSHLPENKWPAFINEVLDHYRTIAADKPQEANTFKFYQLEVTLEAVE